MTNKTLAEDFMADLFSSWLHGEPEIPLREFLHFTPAECNEWLSGQMSHEVAYELYKSRTGRV